MLTFLITFLSIYGGMHIYAFYRLYIAFSFGRPTTIFLTIWFFLMTIAPLLVRLFERSGMDSYAIFIALPGYVWMGFIFIFVSMLIILDLIRSSYWLAHFTISTSTPAFLSSPFTCGTVLLAAVAASCYACYEARQIKSELIIISSPKISPDIPKIRIVQISDVHIGMLFREERLEQVLKIVREAKPDILVSTGDLVDGKLNRDDMTTHQNRLATMLASVPTPAGKYAVTGNHESYAGLNQSLAFTNAAGFKVLRNQSIQLPNGIIISGVDDQVLLGGLIKAQSTENDFIKTVPKDVFHILLKHRPEILTTSDGHIDLQLSGHVHNGQIFPFNFLVKLKYPIPCGTTKTRAGSNIHVSRGTGTWGPPMRLFAPPEVTVIDIIPMPVTLTPRKS
ncbi:MAG: metallophosphoesterase [Deltaproteobacteria bacterium]|nr:metallophosphoesterase [Deltaproteobacteria bacterium]